MTDDAKPAYRPPTPDLRAAAAIGARYHRRRKEALRQLRKSNFGWPVLLAMADAEPRSIGRIRVAAALAAMPAKSMPATIRIQLTQLRFADGLRLNGLGAAQRKLLCRLFP